MTAHAATGAAVLAGIPERIREHFSRRHREVVAVGSKRRLPGNTELDAALARDGAGTSRRGARKKALDWQPGWVLRPLRTALSLEPGEERPPALDGLLVQAVAAHQEAADLLRWERLREAAFPGALAEASQRAREVRLGFSPSLPCSRPGPELPDR